MQLSNVNVQDVIFFPSVCFFNLNKASFEIIYYYKSKQEKHICFTKSGDNDESTIVMSFNHFQMLGTSIGEPENFTLLLMSFLYNTVTRVRNISNCCIFKRVPPVLDTIWTSSFFMSEIPKKPKHRCQLRAHSDNSSSSSTLAVSCKNICLIKLDPLCIFPG